MKISAGRRLRNMEKANYVNDGTRTLVESILAPEVIQALEHLKENNLDCVLIGGLALSYWVKPRLTQDVDVLFKSERDIPQSLPKFSRKRDHAFQHNRTHVEVEILTPAFLNIPSDVVHFVFETAKKVDNISVASPEGLVLLKMERWNIQDKADAVALRKLRPLDFGSFQLDSKQRIQLEHLEEMYRDEL